MKACRCNKNFGILLQQIVLRWISTCLERRCPSSFRERTQPQMSKERAYSGSIDTKYIINASKDTRELTLAKKRKIQTSSVTLTECLYSLSPRK